MMYKIGTEVAWIEFDGQWKRGFVVGYKYEHLVFVHIGSVLKLGFTVLSHGTIPEWKLSEVKT